MKQRVTTVSAGTVLMLATFGALAAGGTRAAGASNLYCGTVKDYGDAIQIMDGKFNPWWDANELPNNLPPIDLVRKGCMCAEGLVKSFQRAGKQAYTFTKIQGSKPCSARDPQQVSAQNVDARKKVDQFLKGEKATVNFVDLNGDGVPEALVIRDDDPQDNCGTHGCTTLVLDLRGPAAKSIKPNKRVERHFYER